MSGIGFRRVKKDDERFGLKAGDIVVVDTNYDWDHEKVICIGKLEVRNNHSLYKECLEPITIQELRDLNEAEKEG
nr:hypothetical protein BdHM001_36260 [Bdellovibrio sp. HM001]